MAEERGPLTLGLSLSHDAAAVLLDGDEVVAAVEEERFTRGKHWRFFPLNAIRYCLDEAGVRLGQVDAIAIGGNQEQLDRRLGLTQDEMAIAGGEPEIVQQLAVWVPCGVALRGHSCTGDILRFQQGTGRCKSGLLRVRCQRILSQEILLHPPGGGDQIGGLDAGGK